MAPREVHNTGAYRMEKLFITQLPGDHELCKLKWPFNFNYRTSNVSRRSAEAKGTSESELRNPKAWLNTPPIPVVRIRSSSSF